jgi:hypothetical protein
LHRARHACRADLQGGKETAQGLEEGATIHGWTPVVLGLEATTRVGPD